MTTTSIKVPTELRDRVQRHARSSRASQAAVLGRALDLLDRQEFFTELSRSVAERPEDAAQAAERDAWLAGPVID